MPLIGPRDLHGSVVIEPQSLAKESQRRQHFHAGFFVHGIRRELRLHELVVGKIVVEGLNYPIAIKVRVLIGRIAAAHGVKATVVVFAITRDIEPKPSPTFAILWRLEQAIHDLRERAG